MRKLICYCLLACVFFTGCTKDKKKELSKSAVKEQPQLNLAKEEKKEPENILYVFINPNGFPCKKQKEIIEKNMDKISSYAKVLYLKTTEPFDRDAFYKYGIRSLPTMILSSKGKGTLHRFTPGIRSIDEIMGKIKS